ncbi:MAG: FAD-binding oxidoreductase [Eubacteriales bacterium]|nr:FAD-binding oxidoreductase [Eubacteriales bacterium]
MADALREDLEKIIPDPDRIITGEISEEYTKYAHGSLKGSADAVVFPISREEVSGIMKYAWDRKIPVTPRGANTNLTGSTVPLEGGIVLDLSHMNRILEIDEDTLTATVEPGVLLGDFQETVESKGLFYPPDPGEKKASLGGNISTNAGGMRAVKYGVTRDFVRGLEVVFADGSIAELGGKTVKDASGLSLKNLLIGSEGTLAVITKAILRLLPKPECSVSAIAAFDDIQAGIRNVIRILHANTQPTALEFAERSVAAIGENYTGTKFPFPDAGAYILMTFDGDPESVKRNLEKTKDVVFANGAEGFQPLSAEKAAEVWTVRGAFCTAVEAVSEQVPVDIVVPIDRTDKFVKFADQLAEETGLLMATYGHAGDGNIHINIARGNLDDETWKETLSKVLWAVYNETADLSGLPSGEHGIGLTKQKFYRKHADPNAVSVMRSVKDALDKKHILNDHKSYLA